MLIKFEEAGLGVLLGEPIIPFEERFRQVSRQLAGGWGIGVEGPSDQGR